MISLSPAEMPPGIVGNLLRQPTLTCWLKFLQACCIQHESLTVLPALGVNGDLSLCKERVELTEIQGKHPLFPQNIAGLIFPPHQLVSSAFQRLPFYSAKDS